jgi:hypothetical protein
MGQFANLAELKAAVAAVQGASWRVEAAAGKFAANEAGELTLAGGEFRALVTWPLPGGRTVGELHGPFPLSQLADTDNALLALLASRLASAEQDGAALKDAARAARIAEGKALQRTKQARENLGRLLQMANGFAAELGGLLAEIDAQDAQDAADAAAAAGN